MSLNLIADPWIPVRCVDGLRRIIAPWQVAEPGIEAPDWPRPDLNIACLELLIGLVYLADPPADIDDWDRRAAPDPARLRERLATFAPAFNLLGDGPLFLQDMEPLAGESNPPDMLFIDSAGANTARNNADLMVHRNRYPVLEPALAAMALYTFQAFAPSGGAGNRTSMRGGGPLVTLVDPGQGLWSLVWANVPYGQPALLADLPWMRATRASDKGLQTLPPEGTLFGPEAFFGMPRRLRLVADGSGVTGVIQKPWGTNYALWKHPLSPYYRMKPGTDDLNKAEDTGAGHLGETAFGSGIYYQYVCVNCDLLVENLNGDRELAARGIEVLAKALPQTAPAGKQNSFAHRPIAFYMRAEAGARAPRDLSGAFFTPVDRKLRELEVNDLQRGSVKALEQTAQQIDACYHDGVAEKTCPPLNTLDGTGTLAEIVRFAGQAVREA